MVVVVVVRGVLFYSHGLSQTQSPCLSLEGITMPDYYSHVFKIKILQDISTIVVLTFHQKVFLFIF